MKTRILLTAALLAATAMTPAWAQEENKPKFKFTPGGRILLDGAVFAPDKGLKESRTFADGVALPDIRVGGKVEYGNWMAKLDIGYAFGKVGLKDVYIQYQADKGNLIRGGYFVHQFGLQSATSSSYKETYEAPITDTYMNATGRNMGFMYLHYKDAWLASASVIIGTSPSVRANEIGKSSYGGISRILWRPLRGENGISAQVGVSNWFQSAMHKKDGTSITDYFDYSASYPTRVDNVTLLSTNVSDARSVYKLSPEFMFAVDRFSLAGQYYYMNINRKNGQHFFQAQGVYGVARLLLLGDKQYGYSSIDGGLATPKPKTLEMVLGYNYTNARDSKAGIYGGISNDYSVTLNYYINKYMLARLRWSYTDKWGVPGQPKDHVNIIEARVQFKF